MKTQKITDDVYVSGQITAESVDDLAQEGFRAIICNRPDDEEKDQPPFMDIAHAAHAAGLQIRYIPVESGKVNDADGKAFAAALIELPKPILVYCRSGTRSATLWSLAEAGKRPALEIEQLAKAGGCDLASPALRIAGRGKLSSHSEAAAYDIVIAGAGSAGIAVAASLLARKRDLDIAMIEPAETHYYQPGWTMVGAGIFTARATARAMTSVLPAKVHRIQGKVHGFKPEADSVFLEDGRAVRYKRLIVCPGLKLDWDAVEGLPETLGKNGVTSNYRYDLAPYTWQLVQGLKHGRALFTQPPMPIKCAGAPQKAMYLSADHWRRNGRLGAIDVAFHNAGGVLFGVPDYVPALMEYVKKYGITLNFNQNLVAVDGGTKKAWFETKAADGTMSRTEAAFDMLHVCPPQTAPDFIRNSGLADKAGWFDVDHATLRHARFDNIYALGDVTCTPNAKTAAAARKQAPVVADNVIADMEGRPLPSAYDGYGSCPLTVERGKIVFAEFLYGGKVAPTFPQAIIDGKKPSRLAWHLKKRVLPLLYWNAMLKGREWLAKPNSR